MEKPKILYVSQEVAPFLPESSISSLCRELPQAMNERGNEIRVFTPRYGKINERRHQLHEVIRLSGMNLIINDTDHPLIIKVASIPSARMQVYFIDSEEYFHRKAVNYDSEGNFFSDNDERAIFFCKGVLETVKKLGWTPDIIHCSGWITAFLPLYVKKLYNDDPHFSDSRIVFSEFGPGFEEKMDEGLLDKLKLEGFDHEDIGHLTDPTYNNLVKMAVDLSDGVIKAGETMDGDLKSYIQGTDKPFVDHQEVEDYLEAYDELYRRITDDKEVLVN